MQKLNIFFKKLANIIELILSFLLAFIFIFMCILVILRYFFNSSIYGGNEILEYLFIYITSLGAAALIFYDEHIKVDFFSFKNKTLKTIQNIIINFLMLFLCSVILKLSFEWIGNVGQFPTPVLHIKQMWAQISIPIGFILSIIFLIFKIICDFIKLIKGEK